MGHNSPDAFKGFRFAGVDGLYFGVGVRAPQYLTVELGPGAVVGAVARLASNLVVSVVSNGPRAHDIVFLGREDHIGLVGCRQNSTSG